MNKKSISLIILLTLSLTGASCVLPDIIIAFFDLDFILSAIPPWLWSTDIRIASSELASQNPQNEPPEAVPSSTTALGLRGIKCFVNNS